LGCQANPFKVGLLPLPGRDCRYCYLHQVWCIQPSPDAVAVAVAAAFEVNPRLWRRVDGAENGKASKLAALRQAGILIRFRHRVPVSYTGTARQMQRQRQDLRQARCWACQPNLRPPFIRSTNLSSAQHPLQPRADVIHFFLAYRVRHHVLMPLHLVAQRAQEVA
jgi:hypothetical protein